MVKIMQMLDFSNLSSLLKESSIKVLNLIDNSNMPYLTKRANRYVQTYKP